MKRGFQVFILFFSIALLMAAAWLLTQKHSPFYKPIADYELITPIKQLSAQDLDEVISPFLGKSFWDIPINEIQASLTRLDWVYQAEVQRKWPNLLYIAVHEQKPVARWGENALMNHSGEVFFPHSIIGFENLVRLNGSLDNSEKVLRTLITLQKDLQVLELLIEEINLSVDNVWKIHLLNGPKIVLDSLNYQQKLQRFLKAYPKLTNEMRKSARVYDLRYSNGFIVAKK